MNLNDIHNLYDFNYWAKSRILSVVEPLSEELYLKDLGSSHGGIHGTLVHSMGAEEIWLKRWKGNSPSSLYKAEDFHSFDELTSHWDMVEHEMMGFCHMLKTEDDLKAIITYKDMKGNQYSQQLYLMMQHLVNHSTYHRGQIVTMLRQSGSKPIGTDMIAYYREKQ